MTDKFDFSALLDRPEGKTLDFKAKGYNLSKGKDKRAFAKDLASLTNTPRDDNAYVVLGVKKHVDGSVDLIGLDKGIDDSDLQAIAGSYLEPAPQFSYRPIQHCGAHLGLITIPINQEKPVAPGFTRGEDLVEGCLYFRRGSRNSVASTHEQERIWEWFRGQISPARFNEILSEEEESARSRIDTEYLLVGPVQMLDLTSDVEEAQSLERESPSEAAELYAEIARILRERFPEYADRFERLSAAALKTAEAWDASHDVLTKLALREIFERAEPKLSAEVVHDLEGLREEVDEVRRARGNALILFGRCHEYSEELGKLAGCFDSLESDDEYAPYIAALFAEAALVDEEFQLVLDRQDNLRKLDAGGNSEIALRIRAALGDAGVPGMWPNLISETENKSFLAADGSFIYLRAARWCAWNGKLDEAKSLCRLGMKLGSQASLDLDVENALWSLTSIYSLDQPTPEMFEELHEINRKALLIEGSRSYVTTNSRASLRSYRYLADEKLPDAHFWARYRLLESIRTGCLADEFESHETLARIYTKSDEHLQALEHAILGGSQNLVKELAPLVCDWPDFLEDRMVSKAPWVRRASHLALKHVGDLAPPDVARGLVTKLLNQLQENSGDVQTAPALLEALGAVILESNVDDLVLLIPYLKRASVRDSGMYRLTDPGVMTLAARLYRFIPQFKEQAASILAEIAVGAHTGEWYRALEACGDETDQLIAAIEQVAERENLGLAGSLSDLGHLTEATRSIWSSRLQFVADHTLGKQTEGPIGPRYDVPAQFLRERDSKVSLQYVEKLVSIGVDEGQFVSNRAGALAAAAKVIDVLSPCDRQQFFRRVQPLVEQPIQISEVDEFHSNSLHPLSRFRMSFGSATDVRSAAGWLLGWAATTQEECKIMTEVALDWIRTGDSMLEGTGAGILTLPTMASLQSSSTELAKHKNPIVRRAVVWMPDMQQIPNTALFEELAADPDRSVRIAVAQALQSTSSMGLEFYERICQRLKTDPSAIVRAFASAL